MSKKKTAGEVANVLRGFDAYLSSAVKAEGAKQAQVVKQLNKDVKELEAKAKGVSRSKAGKLRNWQGATLEQSREMLAFALGREERTTEVCEGLKKSLRKFVKDEGVTTLEELRASAPAWTPDAYLEAAKVKGRRARQLVSQAIASIAK